MRVDVIKYVATATIPYETEHVKNTTSFVCLQRFPVNKARALKPAYTAFVFSPHHATLQALFVYLQLLNKFLIIKKKDLSKIRIKVSKKFSMVIRKIFLTL